MIIETHFHTAETSPCANVSAEDGIRMYHEAGYDAVVVTDHFNTDVIGKDGDWEERVDRFLAGFDIARKTGEKLGVRVYLGMEIRFEENYNDYLVYGFDRQFLYDHPWIYRETMESFSEIAHANGLCIVQAHPFRTICTPAPYELLDGVEGINGNPRHNSRDSLAQEYAEKHGLFCTEGSDFHQSEDIKDWGIEMATLPENEKQLAERILRREFRNLHI